MPSVFVDTNVFLYMFDRADAAKREIACRFIAKEDDSVVTSTQVLQEFYWNATKKLKLTPTEAKQAVELIAKRKVVPISSHLVLQAVETCDQHRISFWDALIVEAAASAKCTVMASEDLNHGQVIRGVKVLNPFLHS